MPPLTLAWKAQAGRPWPPGVVLSAVRLPRAAGGGGDWRGGGGAGAGGGGGGLRGVGGRVVGVGGGVGASATFRAAAAIRVEGAVGVAHGSRRGRREPWHGRWHERDGDVEGVVAEGVGDGPGAVRE